MNSKVKDKIKPYIYILPFVLFYVVFKFATLLGGFGISFTNWRITDNMTFAGVQNYIDIFQDKSFTGSLGHTMLFVLISTPLYVALSFIIACLVESSLIKRKGFYRTSVFMSYILPVSIVTIIWRFIFATYTGLLNNFVGKDIPWLTNKYLVWIAIGITTFWWTCGYFVILFSAGLQNIPEEVLEAARIDGAKTLRIYTHIIVPQMAPTFILITFLQIIASFKIFGQAYLLSFGNPNGASRTVIQYIYETGFKQFNMGNAAAASFVLFVIILFVSIPFTRLLNKSND